MSLSGNYEVAYHISYIRLRNYEVNASCSYFLESIKNRCLLLSCHGVSSALCERLHVA